MGFAQRTPDGPISSVPEPVWERRFVLGLQATVQPNPAIELLDIVQVSDGDLGATIARVIELHLSYYPTQAHHDLVIVGQGR